MEPVSISLASKTIGLIFKLKNWIFDMFWLFKNATKIRNNFDKVTAEKPCPVCKTEMIYTRKEQDAVVVGKITDKINTPGRYWLYYKCTKNDCAFKDEIPFRYATW